MLIEILFIIALVLLITEAFIPAMGVMGFFGFIAYLIGVWMLVSSDASTFYGISITNVIILGLVFFISFGTLIYYLVRIKDRKVTTGIQYLIGQETKIKSWENGMGKVFVDGEDWQVISTENLHTDDIVIITGYDKMSLTVEKKQDI